jgi:hypothetical protein
MTRQSQLSPRVNAAAHAMMLVSGFPKAIKFDECSCFSPAEASDIGSLEIAFPRKKRFCRQDNPH